MSTAAASKRSGSRTGKKTAAPSKDAAAPKKRGEGSKVIHLKTDLYSTSMLN
jgi:hypothetical protein